MPNKTRTGVKGDPRDENAGPVVVGVGASAGGLEALTLLLGALPTGADVAFVVVQHLEPHHPSRLAEILGKKSPIPVHEATDGTTVAPGHAYVIPPNADLTITKGRLGVHIRSAGQSRLAVIDKFFESLAEDAGARSMGVVLSGTGTEGAAGLRHIKEAGGITFAQDPASAAYRGMPDSAIQARVVDFVLKPTEIAAEIVQLLEHPYVAPPSSLEQQLAQDISDIEKVHLLLRNATGIDFGNYKASTFKRRLLRRMALHNMRDLGAYIERLRGDPDELRALYADALISVTSFFREPATFETLRADVLPKLKTKDGRPLRIWVAGCSTGEEVYSLAMAVLESFGDAASAQTLQFFATDINQVNVNIARRGVYQEHQLASVPAPLLRRYFTKIDEAYLISKRIRDMCVFSVHNVYRDPPFSNVDIISCRNVLIYFRHEAQKRALTAFHYSLRAGGTLVLGSSESPGQLSEYFAQHESHAPIYTRLDKALPLAYSIFSTPTERGHRIAGTAPALVKDDSTVRQRINSALLGHYVPPGVITDRAGEVIEFVGHTREFLEPAPGRATLNLFRMARPGLDLDVRAVMMQAKHEHQSASRRVRWKRPGGVRIVDIECIPLPNIEGEELYAITFRASAPEPPEQYAPSAHHGSTIDALETELALTREQLQSTVEQSETTTEELRTANEEALSINEELQSTNEELQTTAEELQSANEELSTLNDELSSRNEELSLVNTDLENLLTSVRFPIVFLGQDQCIRRFTPAAKKAWRLIPTDVGRPISDIRLRLGVEDLGALIQGVIDDAQPVEREIRDDEGWSLLRIQPYRTLDNRIDGAVIVVIDITDLKRARDELERSNHDLQQFAGFTSHELRAPLRNAKLSLGLGDRKLEAGDLAGARQDLANTASGLDRMASLINSLLRFAEVNSSTASHKKVRLDAVVKASMSMLGIDRDGERCRVHIKGPLPYVWADEALLGVVVSNLLSNSMHHSDHAPTVTVTAERHGNMVEVSMRDDGPGLQGIDPGSAFDLFQRGTTSSEGVGLGLAVSRRIIESHGGSIRVAPSAVGADIRFTLPVPEEDRVLPPEPGSLLL